MVRYIKCAQYERYTLYTSDLSTDIWSAFLIDGDLSKDSLSLEEAFEAQADVRKFLFASEQPTSYETFLRKIQLPDWNHGVLWLSHVNDIHSEPKVESSLTFFSPTELYCRIKITDAICIIQNGFYSCYCFDSDNSIVAFDGVKLLYPDPCDKNIHSAEAILHFSGIQIGCLTFQMNLTDQVLMDLHTGFHMSMEERIGLYPILQATPETSFSMNITLDPCHIFAGPSHVPCRTELVFANQPRCLSRYRTTTGLGVLFTPVAQSSRLRFTKTAHDGIIVLSPDGYFILAAHNHAETLDLMGGLFGTEAIRCFANDLIVFEHGHPAHVTLTEQKTMQLDYTYVTSWAKVVRASPASDAAGEVRYIGQPDGHIKYGIDTIVSPTSDPNTQSLRLLGAVDPGYSLPSDCAVFPLLPYSGIAIGRGNGRDKHFTKDDYSDIERFALFMKRRQCIAEAQLGHSIRRDPAVPAYSAVYATTPVGSIVAWNEFGRWTQVQFAQYNAPEPTGSTMKHFQIVNPTMRLQQALQTKELFLVVNNASNIGQYTNENVREFTDAPQFHNRISIEDWHFQARISEFSSVTIIKGCTGKLIDLVGQCEKWTMADSFSTRSQELSNWLVQELLYAKNQQHKGFRKLQEIMDQENWLGCLLLHVDIERLPNELRGLECGIQNRNHFFVHHLIIDKTPVIAEGDGIRINGPLRQRDTSSMFGLIYYKDLYYKADTPQPRHLEGVDYNFKVQELIAYFEGSEIKLFEATAQLTMGRWFGDQVISDNTITLKGKRSLINGHPRYQMLLETEAKFSFLHSVFQHITLTEAELGSTEHHSFIHLNGQFQFRELKLPEQPGLLQDLFSFVSLRSVGIMLDMNCSPEKTSYTFNPDQMSLDSDASESRLNSLKRHLSLQLDGFVSGQGGDPFSKLGCIPIHSGFDLGSPSYEEEPWYGLRFRIHLGTLGELTGKKNLRSTLYLIWRPVIHADRYRVAVGISIPGFSLQEAQLPLQGIMKIALNHFQLVYEEDQFRLKITAPALALFGREYRVGEHMRPLYLYGTPSDGETLDSQEEELAWYGVFKSEEGLVNE